MKEGLYRLRAVATAKGKENYTPPVFIRIHNANLTKKLKEYSKSAEAIVEKYFENVNEGKTVKEQINYRKRAAEKIKTLLTL